MKIDLCPGIFILLMAVSSICIGQDRQGSGYDGSILFRTAELNYRMLAQTGSTDNPEIVSRTDKMSGKKKNVAIGALLSAVVPGAGEIYAGSWIKGAIFMGAETALWIGYGHYFDKGKEWEDIFHEYADTRWSEERWRTWMTAHPDYPEQTHTLPSTKTQQYYEMIGKYDQFMAGWDDYIDGGPELTLHRDYYEGLRNNSNIQLKRASYCVMFALGNRVLSSFDAVWSIRQKNRQIESQTRIGLINTGQDWLPCLTWGVHW